MKNKLNEVWKPIEDYPNYEVSNQGRVRNVKTHRILQAGINRQGYEFVNLCKGDGVQRKCYRINRLVAEAFIDIPQSYINRGYTKDSLQVDHINEDKRDNRKINLQWLTNRENKQKSSALCICGYNHEQMIICDCIKKMDTYYDDKYQNGFNNGNISNVCNGKRNKAYGYKWEFLTKDMYKLLKRFAQINNKIIVVE